VYDGTQHEVWNGILVSDESHINETSADTEWHAKGLLVGQASVQMNRVVDYMPSTDIGTVIPNLLNSVSSKRYEDIDTVVTGIMTLERGSEEDYILDRVQDLEKEVQALDDRESEAGASAAMNAAARFARPGACDPDRTQWGGTQEERFDDAYCSCCSRGLRRRLQSFDQHAPGPGLRQG
jgi:hypothetical protein